MRDDEVGPAPGIDPLRETIRYTLRQGFYMRCPGQYNFRFSFFFEGLLNGNDIRKTLQRMKSGALQTQNWNARIFYKLIDIEFAIIILFVFQRRKCANTEDVKIVTKYGGRIFYVLHGSATHDGFIFKFKRPAVLAYIKYDRIHAQIFGSYLCADAGAHTGIKKEHAQSFVVTEGCVFEWIGFIGKRVINQLRQIRYFVYR